MSFSRPPDNPRDGSCHASVGFPAADLAIGAGLSALLLSPPGPGDNQQTQNAGRALAVVTALGFGASAVAGFVAHSDCQDAKRNAKREAKRQAKRRWLHAMDQRDLAELRFAQRGPGAGWGFAFGMPEEQARSVCAWSGYRATPEPDGFSCSGVPGRVPAAGVTVRVRVADGRVEGAELSSRSDSNDAALWLRAFRAYHDELQRVWRNPDDTHVVQPDACRKGEAFLDCLRSGRAYRRETWRWPGGRRVVLELGARPGEGLAIRVLYDSGRAAAPR